MEIRRCLKCDREFRSTDKFNRLCAKCNKENQRVRDIEVRVDPRPDYKSKDQY